jgi:hypothetical protein
MSGTWRAINARSAHCGSLVLSAEGMPDRPASLTSRDRRETPKPADLDNCWSDRFVIGSVVCRTVDRPDRRCPAPRTELACSAMSLLSFRSPSSSTAGVAGLGAGAYVTDGTRLFRVVQRLDPLRGAAAAVLEDCLTLELRSYGAADLWEMGVRLVRPTSN